jgi:hypothetical protein
MCWISIGRQKTVRKRCEVISVANFSQLVAANMVLVMLNITSKVDGDRVFFTADIHSDKYGRITYSGFVKGNDLNVFEN